MSELLQQVQKAMRALWAFALDTGEDSLNSYRGLSSGWRKLISFTAIVVVAVFLWWALTPSAVPLRLNVRHPFRAAEINVTIDGKQAYAGQLNGQTKKKLLVLDRVEGNFQKQFSLTPGAHTVEVWIHSEANAYDQHAQKTIDAAAGRGGTLSVVAQNGTDLAMVWQPVAGMSEEHSPAFWTTINSMLLTALGAILSAAIGYYVQEFLKSRRQVASGGSN